MADQTQQDTDREILNNVPYDMPMNDEEEAAFEREMQRENEALTKRNLQTLNEHTTLGDTIRAVDALKVKDTETALAIFKMLGGGR